MDIRKLQKIAVTALADIKAEDIEVIDTRKLTAMFDRIIVASGSSNRQVKSLARNVHDKVKEAGGEVYGMEGGDTGEWVLVDLGDIVVHVMQPAVRAYYNLEELWRATPKRAAGDDAPKPAAKKTAAKPKKAAAEPEKVAAKPKKVAAEPEKAAAKPAPKRKPAGSAR
jgi:ribosome-associated protein